MFDHSSGQFTGMWLFLVKFRTLHTFYSTDALSSVFISPDLSDANSFHQCCWSIMPVTACSYILQQSVPNIYLYHSVTSDWYSPDNPTDCSSLTPSVLNSLQATTVWYSYDIIPVSGLKMQQAVTGLWCFCVCRWRGPGNKFVLFEMKYSKYFQVYYLYLNTRTQWVEQEGRKLIQQKS